MVQNKKQDFISTTLATAVVTKVIDKVLEKVAASPNTDITKKDVPTIKSAVELEVADELEAAHEHTTNTEPFYQSRVTLGSLLTICAAIVAMGQMYVDAVPDEWNDYYLHLATIFGAVTALWGRWVAKKPLGR